MDYHGRNFFPFVDLHKGKPGIAETIAGFSVSSVVVCFVCGKKAIYLLHLVIFPMAERILSAVNGA